MGTKENNLINIVVKVGGYYTVPLKDQFGDVFDGHKVERFIEKTKSKYLEKYSNITIYPEDWKACLKENKFSIHVQHLVHFNKIEPDKVKETIDNFLKDNFLELEKREFDWMTKPSFAYAYLKNEEK